MKTVNIHEAKTHLSKLIQKVLKGEEVIISKYGEPLVKLEPYHPKIKRKPGVWKGKVKIADDFDELPPEIEKGFAGELD
jgi:prevent-host-death family protein